MKVSAIIPAYNEEKTIANVINTLENISLIDEIIVVSDGSTDKTAIVAEAAGAKIIRLEHNIGKGGAMMVGVHESQHDIILFLDADLLGLTTEHVNQMIDPVINNQADMVIGIFEQGRMATDLAQFVAPFLSGQRVIKKTILDSIEKLEITRFGVEVALTRYARENGLRVKEVFLHELSHVMKEEKLGVLKGFRARMKMYWEIAKSAW